MALQGGVALVRPTGFTPLSVLYGGENVEENKMRLFAKWVEKKEVRKTPFTDWMKRRSSPYDQPVIETGQSYAPFITTTLTAATAIDSSTIELGDITYVREGDILKITPYYAGDQTELNYNESELVTVQVLNPTPGSAPYNDATVIREGESGYYKVHAIGSEVRVISRAQNYNEPFPDAISWRGDLIEQYVQRFDSGELVYDIAATKTGDYEADNHMLKDIMTWKDILPKYREAAFIQGIRRAPDYDATPQVPGHLGGAIWWAEQGTDTVYEIDGQINPFSFDDILRDKAENHADGPGDTMFGGYKTIAAIDTGLNELKGNFGANETTFTSKVTKLTYRWGDITPRPVHDWPEGVILITSKGDWEWGNYSGMDWQYVERGPEELGAFQRSWTMGGDFSMTCLNVSRQILMTGIDTRLNLYPGRQIFMGGVGVG